MSDKEQIARIQLMEQHLNTAKEAVNALNEALDKFETAQQSLSALKEYYGSAEWRKDLADDEKGLLPQNLKRGVLSEDGIWDVLELSSEGKKRMNQYQS